MDLDLGLLDPRDFPEVYDIMEEAFPADEVRPYDEVKELMDDPSYKILVVKDRKENLGGFLAVWNFPKFNFAEYFAIRRSMRGKGLGSAALRGFLKRTEKPLVLEVEALDTTKARRRIRFYERLGFVQNDINYIEPPTQKGSSPIPLTVLSYPEPIPRKEYAQVKTQIFRQVYGLTI